jgi:hypothetical protein
VPRVPEVKSQILVMGPSMAGLSGCFEARDRMSEAHWFARALPDRASNTNIWTVSVLAAAETEGKLSS